MFMVVRMLYKYIGSFSSKLSNIFDRYKFNLFMIAVLIEGNVQYFMYHFGFEIMGLVKGNYGENCLNGFLVLVNFQNVFIIVSIYFLVESFNERESIKFYENIKYKQFTKNSKIQLIFYHTICLNLKNIIFGFLHIEIINI